MDQYRDLNREMVREVQTMRTNLRLYCDEIVGLKAELLQKRETETNLRKILYKLIMENCLQLTEIVKPDAVIIPLLKESVADLNKHTIQRDSSRQTTNTRRSRQLSAELRRSNTITNIGNNLRSISPIRRRSSVIADENTDEEQASGIGIDEQAGYDGREQAEYERNKNEDKNMVTDKQTYKYNVVFEESEEHTDHKTTEEESSQDVVALETEDEDEDESIAEVSTGIPRTHETLKDVTNLLTKTMDLSSNNSTKYKCTSNSIKLQEQKKEQTLGNSIDSSANTAKHTTCVKEQSKRSSRSVSKITRKLTDCSASEFDEDTLQEPRRNCPVKELKITNRSIPITPHNSNTSGEEASINFCEATSSTPNSRRKSLSPSKTVCVKESLTSSLSISTRPVRQCKPKVLVEPQLKSKLRNEASSSLPKKSKRRKK